MDEKSAEILYSLLFEFGFTSFTLGEVRRRFGKIPDKLWSRGFVCHRDIKDEDDVGLHHVGGFVARAPFKAGLELPDFIEEEELYE